MVLTASSLRIASDPSRSGRSQVHATRSDLSQVVLNTPVLIIEDEAMIAWMLESMFEEMQFVAIELAASAQQAIAAAGARRPGLIISDINLGEGHDGIEAVSEILKSQEIPVVFITGFASNEARRRISHHVPRASILSKPVRSEDLWAAVAKVMKGPATH